MPLPQITVKTWKDGRQVARFRDNQGLVRTRVGPVNWARAEQIKQLAEYGIALQVGQARAGLGSSGSAMPPLTKTDAQWKIKHGLRPVRDLYGGGVGGHMLDDIRISYIDDVRATIAITTQLSRQKALSNEKHSPWWGWTDESVQKMSDKAAAIFIPVIAEELYRLGLIGDNALAEARRPLLLVA